LNVFRIEEATDELLPLVDALYLVKEKITGAVTMVRVLSEVHIQNVLKVIHTESMKAIVFEIEVKYFFLLCALCDHILYFLITKPGLSRAQHADNHIRLAGDAM